MAELTESADAPESVVETDVPDTAPEPAAEPAAAFEQEPDSGPTGEGAADPSAAPARGSETVEFAPPPRSPTDEREPAGEEQHAGEPEQADEPHDPHEPVRRPAGWRPAPAAEWFTPKSERPATEPASDEPDQGEPDQGEPDQGEPDQGEPAVASGQHPAGADDTGHDTGDDTWDDAWDDAWDDTVNGEPAPPATDAEAADTVTAEDETALPDDAYAYDETVQADDETAPDQTAQGETAQGQTTHDQTTHAESLHDEAGLTTGDPADGVAPVDGTSPDGGGAPAPDAPIAGAATADAGAFAADDAAVTIPPPLRQTSWYIEHTEASAPSAPEGAPDRDSDFDPGREWDDDAADVEEQTAPTLWERHPRPDRAEEPAQHAEQVEQTEQATQAADAWPGDAEPAESTERPGYYWSTGEHAESSEQGEYAWPAAHDQTTEQAWPDQDHDAAQAWSTGRDEQSWSPEQDHAWSDGYGEHTWPGEQAVQEPGGQAVADQHAWPADQTGWADSGAAQQTAPPPSETAWQAEPDELAQRGAGKPRRRGRRAALISVLVTLLLAGGLTTGQLVRPLPEPALRPVLSAQHTFDGVLRALPWPAEGQAVVAVDGLGTMGASGAGLPIPTASVAKVMTAYVFLREHPLEPKASGPVFTISAQEAALLPQRKARQESLVEVRAGQRFTQRAALEALMVVSANNIAHEIARWTGGKDAFVQKMNAAARELDMNDTLYTDPSGYDAGTMSTAADQVKLLSAAMRIPAFAEVVNERVYVPGDGGEPRGGGNTLLGSYGVVGGKTGFTDAAGGNFVFAARKDVDGVSTLIVGAVMGQPHPYSATSAVEASRRLLVSATARLTSAVIAPPGQAVAQVDDGLGTRTPLVAEAPVTVVGWPGLTVPVRAEADDVPNRAARGARVGTLTAGPVEIPLLTGRPLREPALLKRLTRTR